MTGTIKITDIIYGTMEHKDFKNKTQIKPIIDELSEKYKVQLKDKTKFLTVKFD